MQVATKHHGEVGYLIAQHGCQLNLDLFWLTPTLSDRNGATALECQSANLSGDHDRYAGWPRAGYGHKRTFPLEQVNFQ